LTRLGAFPRIDLADAEEEGKSSRRDFSSSMWRSPRYGDAVIRIDFFYAEAEKLKRAVNGIR